MNELKKGALLNNNSYRIESILGQGGFGITYLAVHVGLNKMFAVKEFFPKSLCDRDSDTSFVKSSTESNTELVEKLRSKFLKEARHIADLDHNNIVRITDVFEENGTAYYVMDYIHGGSLSERVKKDGPMPEHKAIEYIKKIGSALQYIHSRKMNHLDVKPSNIMVRAKNDTPFLIDFGLAKQYDAGGNQTSTTPVGISHGYAPIEQYKDGGVNEFSPQTDVYALGATLYFLLTGTVPPQAPDLVDSELSFPANFPERLKPIILRAMAPKRQDRYASIADFCSKLDASEAEENTQMMYRAPEQHTETPLGTSGTYQSSDSNIYQTNHTAPVSTKNNKNTILVIACVIGVLVLCGLVYLIYNSQNSGSRTSSVDTDSLAVVEETETSDNITVSDLAEPATEEAPAVEEVDKSTSAPTTPYSAAYYLAGTFTDEYGVERPICLELESTSIDGSPRGKIHNLNANAAVFVTRYETSGSWVYTGSDRGRSYTLTIPRGSSSGAGATININGHNASISFDGRDYYSPRSAATAGTNQARDVNNYRGVSKVKDGYYQY